MYPASFKTVLIPAGETASENFPEEPHTLKYEGDDDDDGNCRIWYLYRWSNSLLKDNNIKMIKKRSLMEREEFKAPPTAITESTFRDPNLGNKRQKMDEPVP